MKILDKYVTKSYLGSFFLCLVLLMVLGAIGDILGFLDDIFKNNIPLLGIIQFYFYFAPFVFVNMVPFAALISAVFIFNNLSKNHEITAVITSGISLWKIMKPVMIITAILCLVTFIVNERFVPWTMAKASEIRKERLETGSRARLNIITNLTVYGKNDIIIFAREYVPGEKSLMNLIIHEQGKDKKVIRKISARKAEWREDKYWQGLDVVVFNIDENGKFALEPAVYKDMVLPIEEKPGDFLNTQSDPRLMSSRQLGEYIDILKNNSPSAVKRLLVDFYYKFSFPFTALAAVFVGIPFSIAAGRANFFIGIAKGITIGMLYLPVTAFSLALGKGGAISPVLSAWLSNIIFVFIGAFMTARKS